MLLKRIAFTPKSLTHVIEEALTDFRGAEWLSTVKADGMTAIHLLRKEVAASYRVLNGPFGQRLSLHTDNNAYGNTLFAVAEVSHRLALGASNTHGSSAVASTNTRWVTDATRIIFDHFGATPYEVGKSDPGTSYDILVRGAGFTGAFDGYLTYLKRHIVDTLLDKNPGKLSQGRVAFTPYEHHSDMLMFQDWGVPTTTLGLTECGVLDTHSIADFLKKGASAKAPYLVLALSMQSNVTSVITNAGEVQAVVQAFLVQFPRYTHRLFISLDLAAYAPHATLNLSSLTRNKEGQPLVDGIAFSPYKLDGGQQGSGVALIRAAVAGNLPAVKAGGTVRHVWTANTSGTIYASTERYDLHNGGSPNVVGLINTALGLKVQEWMTVPTIQFIEKEYARYVMHYLNGYTHKGVTLTILGPSVHFRGSTFPVVVTVKGNHHPFALPPQLVSMSLEHFTGVVTRPGCNCAGPYAYTLLVPEGDRALVVEYVNRGDTNSLLVKAGWTRFSTGVLMSFDQVHYVVSAWRWWVNSASTVLSHYEIVEGKPVVTEAARRAISYFQAPEIRDAMIDFGDYKQATAPIPNLDVLLKDQSEHLNEIFLVEGPPILEVQVVQTVQNEAQKLARFIDQRKGLPEIRLKEIEKLMSAKDKTLVNEAFFKQLSNQLKEALIWVSDPQEVLKSLETTKGEDFEARLRRKTVPAAQRFVDQWISPILKGLVSPQRIAA